MTGEREKGTPGAALPAWRLFRALSPRRRWAGWLAGYGVWAGLIAAGAAGAFDGALDGLRGWAFVIWVLAVAFLFVPAAALAAVFFPAALAPIELFADARSGALGSLLLTGVDRSALLRAYLLRVLATAALLWGLLAVPGLLLGHAPAPLLLARDVWRSCLWGGEAGPQSIGIAGALSDAASMYLAGCVGLACAASLRRRWLAIGAALLVCAVLALAAALGGWQLRCLEPLLGDLFESGGPLGPSSRSPAFATLAQVFAAIHIPVCLVLGELFLRGAARQVDGLVTD